MVYMLSKKNRVPRHLFPAIITKGKNYYSPNIYIRVLNPGFSSCSPEQNEQKNFEESKNSQRFSVVVSKKVSKKAVVRNKLRRSVYGVIQKNIPDIKDNVLAAIFIKKNAAGLSKKEFEEEVFSLFKKTGFLTSKQVNVQKNNN